MEGDLQKLPDDPAALKAMLAEMRRSNSLLEAEVAALKTAGADAQGGGGANALGADSGFDTFVYSVYSHSNIVTGSDAAILFKVGTDKIDISGFVSANGLGLTGLAISTAGAANTVYIERTPGTFNSAIDLAMIVDTNTKGTQCEQF